jgi:hypothetical protein
VKAAGSGFFLGDTAHPPHHLCRRQAVHGSHFQVSVKRRRAVAREHLAHSAIGRRNFSIERDGHAPVGFK